MHLTPHEQERLMIHVAADVAEKRRARGLRLNYPEAIALLTAHALEGARDGKTVVELMESGRKVLTRKEVMEGVPEMITEVQVEATFPDGTKLVTILNPIPVRDNTRVSPGRIEHPENAGNVVANEHLKERVVVAVCNLKDRPVQVGSHYHFYEVNPALEIRPVPDDDPSAERERNPKFGYGMRLNIPAGTAVRFEPHEPQEVTLVPIEGARIIRGLRGEGGDLDA